MMNQETKKNTSATRKVVRYVAGMALLLVGASFVYQWQNGLQVDQVERLGLAFLGATFAASFLPERNGANK